MLAGLLSMPWIVTCPNWQSIDHKNTFHSWRVSDSETSNIGNRFFEELIQCKVCKQKFSLQEGLKESFSIDHPFVIHDFQFNYQEIGSEEIKIGEMKKIQFTQAFEDTPQIYL